MTTMKPTLKRAQSLDEDESKSSDVIRIPDEYTDNGLNDIQINCLDGELWFSKKQLAKESSYLRALFVEHKRLSDIDESGYSTEVVLHLLKWIDGSTDDVPTKDIQLCYILGHKWHCAISEHMAESMYLLGDINVDFLALARGFKDEWYPKYLEKFLYNPKSIEKIHKTDMDNIIKKYQEIKSRLERIRIRSDILNMDIHRDDRYTTHNLKLLLDDIHLIAKA